MGMDYVLLEVELFVSNLYKLHASVRLCHCPGCRSLASQWGGPSSVLGQLILAMWLTEWHWDRFHSEYCAFLPPVRLCHCSTFSSSPEY
jgi:hypothetical protein